MIMTFSFGLDKAGSESLSPYNVDFFVFITSFIPMNTMTIVAIQTADTPKCRFEYENTSL
jgi:hypothetical protein